MRPKVLYICLGLTLGASWMTGADAFARQPMTFRSGCSSGGTRTTQKTPRQRHMSGASSDALPNPEKKKLWKPPPPPEDQIVLIGDLLSLFVYGISDHFIARELSIMMLRTADSPQKVMQLAKDSGEEVLNSLPVFVDTQQLSPEQLTLTLQSTLQDNSNLVAHYSPILQSTGVACCLLAASWLVAGWCHQAFSFRHTLQCRPTTTLKVTFQAWLSTCAIMMSIVALSHVVCGCNIFLTRGDSDYIFDSLTVLVVWRFMINQMLGYSRDED